MVNIYASVLSLLGVCNVGPAFHVHTFINTIFLYSDFGRGSLKQLAIKCLTSDLSRGTDRVTIR